MKVTRVVCPACAGSLDVPETERSQFIRCAYCHNLLHIDLGSDHGFAPGPEQRPSPLRGSQKAPSVKGPSVIAVTYKITYCVTGSASVADVDYRNEHDEKERRIEVPLPWEQSYFVKVGKHQMFRIYASANLGRGVKGFMVCEIYFNGGLWRKSSSEDRGRVSASCTGFVREDGQVSY